MMKKERALEDKIKARSARVAIIGLGYVGLPLAVEFAKAGFHVQGIDIDSVKVKMLNAGKSYIQDVSSAELDSLVSKGWLCATDHYAQLKEMDTISICVPTPLSKTKDPDISCIIEVTREISKTLRPGQLIILESTTYPGTTEEAVLPILLESGLKVGKDFFLAFSPERVDPGNKVYTTKNTPKIIGGVTPLCAQMAKALYESAIEKIVLVSSTRSAEMVKLLENTFRAVNIALVNEIALMCNMLRIDVWEVIDAAATKPFGFMPFYPGPGLGGHCIPIDPHYLAWKLKTLNYKARFIELASEINTNMPYYVVNKITDALNGMQKSVNGSKVLVLGIGYKKDIDDIRESPALDIIQLLQRKFAQVFYHDPYLLHLDEGLGVEYLPLEEKTLEEVDCVVIVTDHSQYNYQWIVDHAQLVIDTRNATKGVRKGQEKIVKL
jgi:UDP-N-acetyl-D-glucosamine dehydrogenase